MTFWVRPEARADVLEAAQWYEDQQPGLGEKLVAAVDDIFSRIEAGPMRYPRRHKQLRRALIGRFPYSVFFAVNGSGITVFAVWHQSRTTAILDDRLKR